MPSLLCEKLFQRVDSVDAQEVDENLCIDVINKYRLAPVRSRGRDSLNLLSDDSRALRAEQRLNHPMMDESRVYPKNGARGHADLV